MMSAKDQPPDKQIPTTSGHKKSKEKKSPREETEVTRETSSNEENTQQATSGFTPMEAKSKRRTSRLPDENAASNENQTPEQATSGPASTTEKEKSKNAPGTSKDPTEQDEEITKEPLDPKDESQDEGKTGVPKPEPSKESEKTAQTKFRKFIRNVGMFFGVVDELNLHLWREAFERRIMENDVGLSIRNSFGCLIPIFHKCHIENKDPRRVEENETVEKNRNIDKKVDKRKTLPPGDGGYGYAGDGLAYYFYLQKIESLIPQGASGQAVPTFRQKNIVELCKHMFITTEDMPENEIIKLNHEITEHLRPKPYNMPFFIIVLTIIQLLALIATMLMGGSGIEFIGVHPKVLLHKDIVTFRGKENVDVWIRPNIWIGAPLRKLIAVGAVYSPCMRTDWAIAKILKDQSFGTNDKLGCCQVEIRGLAGTTTQKECDFLTVDGGKWYEKTCSDLAPNATTILRPCCFGLLGNCKMTTEKGCNIHGGHYFDTGPEHCSEAFCFPYFCGSVGLERSSSLPYMPARSNQGWRLLVSVIFHAGILHFILIALLQWILGRPVEGLGGWLRILLIYLLTSIGSNLVGAFFDPYLPQMGCNGGVAGLVGIALIEVGQAHKKLGRGAVIREVLSLLAVILILLITGFFPLINNFTHIGGILFGIPIGILFLPHLCFNTWSCQRRRYLVLISATFLIVLVIIFFALFYLVQDTGFCRSCYIFSCIPFTNRMCDLQMDLIGTITRD